MGESQDRHAILFIRLTRRRTLLLAGHDTSANSLTWFLWEVAKHPESAREIREEIAAVRARIGVRDFSITDLEGMSTMLAALKVMWSTALCSSVPVSVILQLVPCRNQCGCTLSYGSFQEWLLVMMPSRLRFPS